MPPHTDLNEVVFSGRKIRCVLAHDHVLLRHGLQRLLQDEPDMQVVGEADNAAECLRKVFELRPDVLVADSSTFGLTASDVELLVAKECSGTKIVFLSMEENSAAPHGETSAGRNFAVRQTSGAELVEMVRMAGGNAAEYDGVGPDSVYVSSSYMQAGRQDGMLRRESLSSTATMPPPQRELTAREREVLKLLAEGKTVRGAATVLGVSSKTVDAHKFNLMRKLGIHNKAELVMWAIQRRVVKIPVNF